MHTRTRIRQREYACKAGPNLQRDERWDARKVMFSPLQPECEEEYIEFAELGRFAVEGKRRASAVGIALEVARATMRHTKSNFLLEPNSHAPRKSPRESLCYISPKYD